MDEQNKPFDPAQDKPFGSAQGRPKMDPKDELEAPSGEMLLEEVDEATELKKKLEDAEAKAADYLAGWQRAKADFSNYKKDEGSRFEDLAKYSFVDLMKEFISVLDSFDLAITALEKNGPVEKGVYMIRSQIEDLLEKRGLQKLEVEVGSDFDPRVAEAVAETESGKMPGKIVEVIESGYKLFEKIIRPARVIVGKIINK